MNAFKSLIKQPKSTSYDGEDKDEQILYILRASTLLLFPTFFLTGVMAFAPLFIGPFLADFRIGNVNVFGAGSLFVLGIFWYLFVAGYALQSFLNWFFNSYIITNKKIVDIDFHGVLYKNISEATLTNIEDITSNVKGTLGIVFNIGSVLIQTAAEKPEFEFSNIENPAKIRDIIADLVAETRKNYNGTYNN
jgi:membrane protein YdbS with pleckstrin-like domain